MTNAAVKIEAQFEVGEYEVVDPVGDRLNGARHVAASREIQHPRRRRADAQAVYRVKFVPSALITSVLSRACVITLA
jgi:hypothetical protein